MAVTQSEQGRHGEMRAGRLAADREQLGHAELALPVLEQPERGVLAVVRSGGIRMLRGQAVPDADRAQAGGLDE